MKAGVDVSVVLGGSRAVPVDVHHYRWQATVTLGDSLRVQILPGGCEDARALAAALLEAAESLEVPA